MQQIPNIPSNPERHTESPSRRKNQRGIYNQYFSTTVISISYLIYGHAVAWTSPTLYMMRKYGEPMNLTTKEASLMVSLFYVGNFAMPIPSGILADMIGRKLSMMILSVLAIISWILAYYAVHVISLLMSRFLMGLWAGSVMTISPMFIGEISDSAHRGAMSASIAIFLNVGVLLAFFVNPRMSYRTVAIVFGAFPIIMVLLFFFIPESPLWLNGKGKHVRAWKSLLWLRAGKAESEIRQELELLVGRRNMVFVRPFCMKIPKGTRKALVIVEVLSILQRLCGASAVVGYASMTLPEMSFGAITSLDMVGFMATIWFLSAVTNPFLIDKFGRKPLLVISSTGVAFSMLFASIYWFIYRNSTPQTNSLGWVAFVLLSIYGVFFNVGLGPVVPTIQGEMLHPDIKGIASGFTAMVLAGASSISTAIFPPITDYLGAYVNFIIYCIVGVVSAAFSWFYVIETKGRTLNEIQIALGGPDHG